MERLRVFARQCGDARTDLSGDARLISGESLRKACPALVSVMSGFIRRDRGSKLYKLSAFSNSILVESPAN